MHKLKTTSITYEVAMYNSNDSDYVLQHQVHQMDMFYSDCTKGQRLNIVSFRISLGK